MRRFIAVAVILLSFFAFAEAQSGRRVKAAPTPEPKVENAAPDYSESAPQPKRILPPSMIRGDNRSVSDNKPIPVPNGTPEEVSGDDVVKVETDLVTIPVSVFDRNGLYIPNLRQADFKIFEDGKEQPIAYFGTTDQPFTVILLIDTSPSTEYKIEEIQSAARSFVDQLSPNDTVMVIEFAWNVHVLAEPTTDRQILYKAIQKSDFGDGTSLYDAVDFSLRKRLNQIQGRKAIVLFTDGVDTTSRKSSYDKSLALAEESDSLIFPIYYNTFFDQRRRGSSMPPDIFYPPVMTGGGSAADYAMGKKYLDDLAAYTGGRVFRPESTPGGLNAAFEGIAEELRRQYSIGFVPTDDGKPGDRKQIKVRVARSNVVVRARDSYIVGTKQRATP